MNQVPGSISVYVVLCIVLLRGRFGGLSSFLVDFGGVGRTCDGCSFGTTLGELQDRYSRVPDLDLPDRMPSGTTWLLPPFTIRTQGGWLAASIGLRLAKLGGMLNG